MLHPNEPHHYYHTLDESFEYVSTYEPAQSIIKILKLMTDERLDLDNIRYSVLYKKLLKLGATDKECQIIINLFDNNGINVYADQRDVEWATLYGSIEALDFIKSITRVKFSSKVARLAIRHDNLNVLKWFHSNGFDMLDPNNMKIVISISISNEKFDIISWMSLNTPNFESHDELMKCLNEFCTKEFVMKWLEHSKLNDDQTTIDWIVNNCYSTIINKRLQYDEDDKLPNEKCFSYVA